jgi:hypothetical protein
VSRCNSGHCKQNEEVQNPPVRLGRQHAVQTCPSCPTKTMIKDQNPQDESTHPNWGERMPVTIRFSWRCWNGWPFVDDN